MNTVDKIVALARTQKGYTEKAKQYWVQYGKDCLYEMTKYAGSDNYTKYGYEMHELNPKVMDFPAYWCDCYVDDLFYLSYGVANITKLIGGMDDYTKGSINLYKQKGAFFLKGEKEVEVGDQVFFTKDKKLSGVHHTGLVIEVYEKNGIKYILTSEGNTSDGSAVVANGGQVCEKEYRQNDVRIYGYGRPAYDKEKILQIPIETEGIRILENLNIRSTPELVGADNVVGTYKKDEIVYPSVRIENTSVPFLMTDDGFFSARKCEGWIKDENGKWWYLMNGYSYPKSCLFEINGKEYAFDKDGYLLTNSRFNDDGSIKYE